MDIQVPLRLFGGSVLLGQYHKLDFGKVMFSYLSRYKVLFQIPDNSC